MRWFTSVLHHTRSIHVSHHVCPFLSGKRNHATYILDTDVAHHRFSSASLIASLAWWYGFRRESRRPGFDSRFCRGFKSSHTSDLKVGRSIAVAPARLLAVEGPPCDWLARCQHTVTGGNRMFDKQVPSECGSTYSCLNWDVKQPTNNNSRAGEIMRHTG